MGRSWMMGFKGEQAAKRGNIFTKLSKEISVAARLGGPDPANNPRLRGAVEDARKASMPRDNIERAVKKGAGLLEGMAYEDITYEGYAPHGVAVLVECVTDNRNRTVSEVRTIFRDHDGNMGESNSVAWMFDRIGAIDATHPTKPADVESEAIEVNAQNVEDHGNGTVSFITDPADLAAVSTALEGRGWKIEKAEMSFHAKNAVKLEGEELKKAVAFLQELNAHDDVRRVHATLA